MDICKNVNFFDSSCKKNKSGSLYDYFDILLVDFIEVLICFLHPWAHLCRYDMMLSCWSHDPLKRPSFRKLVERTELLLSENTKNVS